MCGLAVVLAFWSTTGIYWNQFDSCRPSLYGYLDIPHHALNLSLITSIVDRHWVGEANGASKATPAVAEASEATNSCTPPQILYNSKTIYTHTVNSTCTCIQLLPTQAGKH